MHHEKRGKNSLECISRRSTSIYITIRQHALRITWIVFAGRNACAFMDLKLHNKRYHIAETSTENKRTIQKRKSDHSISM